MSYTKITVPRSPVPSPGVYIRCDTEESPPSVTVQTPPCEVQPTESKPCVPSYSRRLHFGVPVRLLLAATIGFISFIAGCALGDRDLCRMLVTLSAASGGKTAYTVPQSADTVYARYRDEPPTVDTTPTIPFAEAAPVPSDPVPAEAAEEAPAASVSADPVYADGQTLLPIEARDFSCSSVWDIGNQTSFTPDISSLLERTPISLDGLRIDADEPLVLIVHTHGTECYNEEGYTDYYRAEAPVRSEDETVNVVSMGTELENVLTAFGIPVLHDTKMCDKESFVKAYSVSYEEVTRELAAHPSIRFVIDLHRDAIEGNNGLRYKPVFDNAGEKTAQLMFVVGTNAAGNAHPNWEENLSLALHVQKTALERFPGLMRHINLRQASFNQQLSSGYMLLECGACSNTHDEAKRAVRLFGEALARVIHEYAEA